MTQIVRSNAELINRVQLRAPVQKAEQFCEGGNMNLQEANQLVLGRIAEVDETMVVGFLPLTEPEEKTVLELLAEELQKPGASIERLLSLVPAAAVYGLAVAPSRTLTSGGRFWSSLRDDLGLVVGPNQRAVFSDQFRRTCRFLGLLDGTIEDSGWIHAAPFIFQAGILHFWKDALASGLITTLKLHPAPDLEDTLALQRFAKELEQHVHNQPTLKKFLTTEGGSLLAKRLVEAYVKEDWTVLPPHLQQPIREAFSNVGSGRMLRSPHLAIDLAFRHLQIVLPSVSPRLASEETYWRVDGRRYAARRDNVISLTDLSESVVSIELCELMGDYERQTFSIDTHIDENTPFRVFRADTGRERTLQLASEVCLNPGSYIVVMSKDVLSNDEDYVKEHDDFRELEVEFRPGGDALVLNRNDTQWKLDTALTRGIYIDRTRARVATLDNEELLHFGDDLGLVAYFPAKELTDTEFTLEVSCPEQSLHFTQETPRPKGHTGTYVFEEELQEAITEALDQLEPGIHQVRISLAQDYSRVERRIWYWKGLERISVHLGFQCQESPRNLDIVGSRGLLERDGKLEFDENFHGPAITLALTAPNERLRIQRAGVRALISEPDGGWEDEPKIGDPLVVESNDRRVLKIESGGFQAWTILGNKRPLASLDSKRTTYVATLAGLAAELGGGGRIEARSEDGRSIGLASFTKPLTASAPRHLLNDQEMREIWKFKVPLDHDSEVGVAITDLSTTPDQPIGAVEPIASWRGDELEFEEVRFGAATIIVMASAADTEEAPCCETGKPLIKFKISIDVEEMGSGLWAIDFFRRSGETEEWLPLNSEEAHGYSNLRFYGWGDASAEELSGWWPFLRQARRKDEDGQRSGNLEKTLSGLDTDQLALALRSCRELLAWKYPSAVWKENAHRFQGMPVCLGRHRFNIFDDSASVWWSEGLRELSEHSRAQSAPVTRQFLLASQPAALRIPRQSMGPLSGEAETTDLVTRSLSAPQRIREAGSLKHWVLEGRDTETLDPEVIFCFQNFMQVHTGDQTEFEGFSLRQFLRGGVAGISGLESRVNDLYETAPRFQATTLLSPEHLLHCVRMLNRRTRVLEQVTQSDQEMALSSLAQSVERMSQRLEMVAPGIAEKLDWDCPGGPSWWTPPLLVSTWASKVAGLLWCVTAVSRLAANELLSPAEFEEQLRSLLCQGDDTDRTLQNRLCILLSMAPEYFAFLVALFELRFPVESSN